MVSSVDVPKFLDDFNLVWTSHDIRRHGFGCGIASSDVLLSPFGPGKSYHEKQIAVCQIIRAKIYMPAVDEDHRASPPQTWIR